MNFRTIALILLVGAAFSSCHDVEVPTLKTEFPITFHAQYDGQPLKKSTFVPYDTMQVKFDIFTLYVSYIKLKSSKGDVLLADCEYLDFTPVSQPTGTSATPVLTYHNVPEGDYTGIEFGYGVQPDLNGKTPADFPANHALAKEEQYWGGWRSYIFSKIEGQGDTNKNGQADMYMVYHTGANDTYKEVTFEQPIVVKKGGKGLDITFDLKQIFTNPDGSLYDIITNFQTHSSPTNLVVAQYIMGNYKQATTVAQ